MIGCAKWSFKGAKIMGTKVSKQHQKQPLVPTILTTEQSTILTLNEKFAFSNCNVTINNINRQNPKRRRVIYSSESENSQEN